MKRRIYQRRKDGDVKEEDEKENKKRSDKKERKIMALKSTHKKLRKVMKRKGKVCEWEKERRETYKKK